MIKIERRKNTHTLDRDSVLSAAQLTGLADIAILLASACKKFSVAVKFGDLADPFDVRIQISCPSMEIWLYPDGADVSGEMELRLEIEEYENPAELFGDLISKISEELKFASES